MEFNELINTIASWLTISPEWLVWPGILKLIIIFGFNWAGFYALLQNGLKIFKSEGVNATLGFIFTLMILPISVLTVIAGALSLTVIISALFIGWFMIAKWKYRILFFIGLWIFFFYILPIILYIQI
jgi:hypothetical protein